MPTIARFILLSVSVRTSRYDDVQVCIMYLIVDDDESSVDKRKASFIRLGKRKASFIRFGKRKASFIRFG
jgi:hypothetical protein